MHPQGFQVVNGQLARSPIAGLWGLGAFTERDPKVPWLPLEGDPDPLLRADSQNTGVSISSIAASVPAGTTDGDGMLAAVMTSNVTTARTVNTLAGWTLINAVLGTTHGGYETRLYVFQKRASGESGSYTFTFSGTAETAEIWVGAYKDVKATGSFIGSTSQNSGNSQTTTGSAITAAKRSLLAFIVNDWQGAGGALAPSGMALRKNTLGLFVADQAHLAAGSTGNKTHTNTNTDGTQPFVANMIELLADVGGNNESSGVASGVGTASGVGRSTARDDATASGIGTASAVGRSHARSSGAASGVGTASAAGRALGRVSASASGLGSGIGIGRSLARAPGVATAVGIASGSGRSRARADAATSALGAAAGIGRSTARAVGNASATGTQGGVGARRVRGDGAASGFGSAAALTATPGSSDDAVAARSGEQPINLTARK